MTSTLPTEESLGDLKNFLPIVQEILKNIRSNYPHLVDSWEDENEHHGIVLSCSWSEITIYLVKNKHTWFNGDNRVRKSLQSSRHFVLLRNAFPSRQDLAEVIQLELYKRYKGHKAEELALKACNLAQRERPDLIVDVMKTGDASDMGDRVDIRIGISHLRTSRVIYLNFDVKSSHEAVRRELETKGNIYRNRYFLIPPKEFLKNPEQAVKIFCQQIIEGLEEKRDRYFNLN